MKLTHLLLLVLVARPATAQRDTSNRDTGTTISGIVRDSIAHTPLANATVQLVARDNAASFERTSVSDSLGHYLLSDVPFGQYRLGFFHPILDSLGVDAPLRDVYVDSYRPKIVDLAVPSAGRLRLAICGAQQSQDSGGVIIGTVRDARDGSPAPGVTVAGEWLEYSLTRTGMVRRMAKRTATTAETGWFALCDVPTSGSVALIANKGTDSTGLIEVEVPAEGLVRRELYIGPAQATVIADTRDSSGAAPKPAPGMASNVSPPSRRILVGNGRITGTVTSVAQNRPLPGAQVTIIDGPTTRTNERGEWAISNAPTGTRMLEVRALGYYPGRTQVNIVANAAPVSVALSTLKAMLDTVQIRASRLPNDMDSNGFNQRRRTSGGKFITADDIRRFPIVTTSDLFKRVSGVRNTLDTGKVQMRGMFEEWCDAAVFINDHYMPFLTQEDIDAFVPPNKITGVEIYTGAMVPPQFQPGLGGCGSIVIWTK